MRLRRRRWRRGRRGGDDGERDDELLAFEPGADAVGVAVVGEAEVLLEPSPPAAPRGSLAGGAEHAVVVHLHPHLVLSEPRQRDLHHVLLLPGQLPLHHRVEVLEHPRRRRAAPPPVHGNQPNKAARFAFAASERTRTATPSTCIYGIGSSRRRRRRIDAMEGLLGEDAQAAEQEGGGRRSESCGLGHLRPWGKDMVPFLMPLWWWWHPWLSLSIPFHSIPWRGATVVDGVLDEAGRQTRPEAEHT